MLQNFSQDRPSLQKNNTPEQLIILLQNEVIEASQSLTDHNNLASELSDVLIFALTIANLYGFNMDEEVKTKIAFNTARYSAIDFNGDYEDARLKGKKREKDLKEIFGYTQQDPSILNPQETNQE